MRLTMAIRLTIFSILYFGTCLALGLCTEISPHEASQSAVREKLSMPEPYPDGRIQTLNKKGAMSPDLDKISKEFVEFAAQANCKMLEIGAGYGNACLKALQLGAQDYHANDMDVQHLKILAHRAETLDKSYLSYIHLIPATFSDQSLDLFKNQYDAILIARVLHFMTPFEVSTTLNQAYKILKPGGKIYAVMLSPYVKGFAAFIPEFENRIKNHQSFPGYVNNLKDYIDNTLVSEAHRKGMDNTFLFFNIKTACDCFKQCGFVVETSIDMPLAYPSDIWQLDGRENIGLVAYKSA